MSGHCCSSNVRFEGLSPAYRRALLAVIAINGAMFVTELAGSAAAGSQALQADSLDFLGDTMTYAISLAVIGKSIRVRSLAAIAKGISLSLMAAFVFGATLWRVLYLGVPSASIMGGIGTLALAANLASVLILLKYRDGDANVRSVWLCSRNDAIGNLVVVAAAGGVFATRTGWPDVMVAGLMAGLFLWSSVSILRQAIEEWKSADVALEPALPEQGAGHGR
ncbi:cation transporter [Rhizobiales bacterium]|uniref:cation transporter n=1 Tax=Hongsoonwoonella zoysiae TaxID=2821844 RepID=UPI00155FCDE4|nr:cation transporter [Hongsoonwoonella zoysiae]NRG19807.1 cation transporter [Hongsoonwoonella zoysiae]